MSPAHPELHKFIGRTLIGWADDELVLGHRNSEWCGHAPILEEDIAFANIALDELGHALLWYGAYAKMQGEDPETGADRLVFERRADAFRCVQLVELPNRDWAFTIVRQYLFDIYEAVLLAALEKSTFEPVAEIAAKVSPEEFYHRRHSEAWTRRLGLGTEESNRRMQAALNHLWPYTAQLFVRNSEQQVLAEAGVLPSSTSLHEAWTSLVYPYLTDAGLQVPGDAELDLSARGSHSQDFESLIAHLQSVAAEDPGAVW